MKTLSKLLLIAICSACMFAACKKDKTKSTGDLHNRDISKLSLTELKTTITGNWKLVYSWGYYQGKVNYPNTYINFYNFAESINWIENNVETVRTNATYKKGRSITSGLDYVYTISYFDVRYNLTRSWGAYKILNDTLVIGDNQQSEPTTYYLIK